MATYVCGDRHGTLFQVINFIDRLKLDEKDTIIILGDMGLYWDEDKSDADRVIEYYEKTHRTHILWLDGNHENFNLINELPQERMSSFKRCSDHIHYIPRGTVFYVNTRDGLKRCLAYGGADSIDKKRRVCNKTWWAQEQITDEEMNEYINHITSEHIDYVFTHCCPREVFDKYQFYLCTLPREYTLDADHTSENNLDKLMKSLDFDKWMFGHYHIDMKLDDKFTCVFNNFIEL